jgi:hypothetical protein
VLPRFGNLHDSLYGGADRPRVQVVGELQWDAAVVCLSNHARLSQVSLARQLIMPVCGVPRTSRS